MAPAWLFQEMGSIWVSLWSLPTAYCPLLLSPPALVCSQVSTFVKMIVPEGALVFHEKAWNAYRYCCTSEFFNEYIKDDQSLFFFFKCFGTKMSHNVSPATDVDANVQVLCSLQKELLSNTELENFMHRQERRIFTNFHQEPFCWIEFTKEVIPRMEDETQRKRMACALQVRGKNLPRWRC
uniref:Phosphatidylinositol transfer protein beta isoform n=1 Tax=Scleropages formosus TaxID=113540 RepID=A0A8C9S739_SCLFO